MSVLKSLKLSDAIRLSGAGAAIEKRREKLILNIERQIEAGDHPLNGYSDIAKRVNRLLPEFGHGGSADRVEIGPDEVNGVAEEVLSAVQYKEHVNVQKNVATQNGRSLNSSTGHPGVDFSEKVND